MTQCLEFYRCEICGNIVQVLHSASGTLVCCGQPMKCLEPQTVENHEMGEKHVPVFGDYNKIMVGSVPHPMLAEHHIEFIEAVSQDKKCLKIKFLDINEEPSMHYDCDNDFESAYEYCNIHGLWMGQK